MYLVGVQPKTMFCFSNLIALFVSNLIALFVPKKYPVLWVKAVQNPVPSHRAFFLQGPRPSEWQGMAPSALAILIP